MHTDLPDPFTHCGCSETDCWAMPPEFVRVRYYFGQRLGVLELNDEALYHGGKHAFHNARLHGVGVLCGLRAERFVVPPASISTVLRVSSGAALDACGREILVGVDQCIDVAAWLTMNKAKLATGAPTKLWVALRYRECPSDPSPAPRDPCGCDTAGCEFGRVREGFELALLTDDEHAAQCGVVPALGPEALAAGAGGDPADRLRRAILQLTLAACPTVHDAGWMCLASFDLTFDGTGKLTAIGDPDNTIPQRQALLPASALQALLLDLAADGISTDAFGTGPSLGGLAFDATTNTLALAVTLAPPSAGPPGAPDVTLVQKTFDDLVSAGLVTVEQFDAAAATPWTSITASLTIAYDAANTRVTLVPSGAGTWNDGTYRLAIDQPLATPAADAEGRSLRPLRWARRFRLTTPSGGSQQLDPSV